MLYRYDFVNIYDGEDEFAAQIASLTGILPNPVESSGNTIFINFLSDYDTGETGFRIGYEAGEFIRTNKYQTLYIYIYIYIQSFNLNTNINFSCQLRGSMWSKQTSIAKRCYSR